MDDSTSKDQLIGAETKQRREESGEIMKTIMIYEVQGCKFREFVSPVMATSND
jgi:hypothetical protein